MASARENDLNPDVSIGLTLPFNRGSSGLFPQSETTLEQATPKAATDPVGFGIALGRLTNVISKFARGDFLRFDIITD